MGPQAQGEGVSGGRQYFKTFSREGAVGCSWSEVHFFSCQLRKRVNSRPFFEEKFTDRDLIIGSHDSSGILTNLLRGERSVCGR